MHTQAASRVFVRNSDVPVPAGRSLQSIPPCFLPFQTRSRYAVRENPDPTATHSTPPAPQPPRSLHAPLKGGALLLNSNSQMYVFSCVKSTRCVCPVRFFFVAENDDLALRSRQGFDEIMVLGVVLDELGWVRAPSLRMMCCKGFVLCYYWGGC